MTTIDIADRKGRQRAIAFYVFGVWILVLLMVDMQPVRRSLFDGLWLGMTLGAAICLTPVKRWLRPGSALVRLLDDETAQEHRRMAATAGFWAAMGSALALALVTQFGAPVSATDVARVIASAAIAAALLAFATLELRAAR